MISDNIRKLCPVRKFWDFAVYLRIMCTHLENLVENAVSFQEPFLWLIFHFNPLYLNPMIIMRNQFSLQIIVETFDEEILTNN